MCIRDRCEMGKFLCEQADLKLKRVTTIGGSVHLGDMNNEKKNVRKFSDTNLFINLLLSLGP